MQVADGGSYDVVIVNAVGAVTSEPALLTIADLPTGPPAEDLFANRNQVFGNNGGLTVDNLRATREPGEPNHAGKPGGKSVWYEWVAPATGIAVFRTAGSGFDTLLAIYTGDNVTNLILVASNEDSAGFLASEVRFNARANTAYQIAIDGYAGASGTFVLTWLLEPTAQTLPVITDQPVGGTVPPGASFTFSVGASDGGLTYQWFFRGTAIPGATGPSYTVPSVQPTNVGTYFVRLSNAAGSIESAPAVLEIAVGRAVQSADKAQDLIARELAAASGEGQGQFRARPPAAAPSLVSGGFVPVAAGVVDSQVLDNFGASSSFGEPVHCGVAGGASKWFGLRPTSDGVLVIDTVGSSFNTVLAVYTGPTNYADPFLFWSRLRAVACDNNGAPDGVRSQVAFLASAGTNYMLAIDGVGGAQGVIQLNWRLTEPLELPQTNGFLSVWTGRDVILSAVSGPSIPGARYQWRLNGVNIPGATNLALVLANTQVHHGGDYTVSVPIDVSAPLKTIARLVVTALDFRWSEMAGQPVFRLTGQSSHRLQLEATSDILTWQLLHTTGAPKQPFDVFDLQSTGQSGRYYRLVPLP
jgi:hypothetical protein